MQTAAPIANEISQSRYETSRVAQAAWSERPLSERLQLIKRGRHELAKASCALVDAMPLDLMRTRADSYVSELLPLLSAFKFVETAAKKILRPRKLGRAGRPLWLGDVDTVVERVPFGVVLIIAPSNYPLLLAGVQAMQAIAAGNAVIWKPGTGGRAVAVEFAAAFERAGLPPDLLCITGDSAEDGRAAMLAGADKIFFTGSAETGKQVLETAAHSKTPTVAELSGCDAIVVLPSADMNLTLEAITFGVRFNGSCTCMAPRRLFLVGGSHHRLIADLRERFKNMAAVPVPSQSRFRLQELLDEASLQGAVVHGEIDASSVRPIMVQNVTAVMRIAQADIFAPVLTVMEADDVHSVVEMDKQCPFGLSAAIFGDAKIARKLGEQLNVGTVIINDLIVPTADPRIPFGGRRGSGFGSTRGAEGLLEMTAAKVIAVRKRTVTRHFEPTSDAHETLFAGLIAVSHGAGFREKLAGLRGMIQVFPRLRQRRADDRETR